MNYKTSIIICTRTNSERVPNKPFKKIAGREILNHLLDRLEKAYMPVILAVPREQVKFYEDMLDVEDRAFVNIYASDRNEDVLKRMSECAEFFDVENIIRITHDKILIDEKDLYSALDCYYRKDLDYLYSSSFIAGTGLEIIKASALKKAAKAFKNVEHISYAIKAVTKNTHNFKSSHQDKNYRFLIDYPEDVTFFEALFSQVGTKATLQDCLAYLCKNPEIKRINSLPKLTVYTCAYNGEAYLEKALTSVAKQNDFKKFEYILVDDGSQDKTCEIMAKFCLKHKNARWIRNEKNLGLASSSNVALKEAKGKYIIRLDSDDYFTYPNALKEMIDEVEATGKDIIYPNNHFGKYGKIQKGKECNHVGGAIFNKSALNFVKFTDGLRGHDSLDVFLRAKDQLNIGYLNKPTFFYRQHDKSLTKEPQAKRDEIKTQIIENYKTQREQLG
jgi:spore coat polysaccharide biosynthesis protein SpsF (cytidylyltransferase family)